MQNETCECAIFSRCDKKKKTAEGYEYDVITVLFIFDRPAVNGVKVGQLYRASEQKSCAAPPTLTDSIRGHEIKGQISTSCLVAATAAGTVQVPVLVWYRYRYVRTPVEL